MLALLVKYYYLNVIVLISGKGTGITQLRGRSPRPIFRMYVTERLNMKLSINRSLTTMMTGHGNIKAYLHRFKLIDSATCPCGDNDQTTDHLLYDCKQLQTQRDTLTLRLPD